MVRSGRGRRSERGAGRSGCAVRRRRAEVRVRVRLAAGTATRDGAAGGPAVRAGPSRRGWWSWPGGRARRRCCRSWRCCWCSGLVGLLALLFLNTELNKGAFTIKQQKATATKLEQQSEQIQQSLDSLDGPGALASKASQMGMVPNPNPAFLAPNGSVLGSPTPAPTPTTPPSAPTAERGRARVPRCCRPRRTPTTPTSDAHDRRPRTTAAPEQPTPAPAGQHADCHSTPTPRHRHRQSPPPTPHPRADSHAEPHPDRGRPMTSRHVTSRAATGSNHE